MKWLIEGVLDIALLEVVLLSAGLGIAILLKGIKINRAGFPWLLFILNIILSLLISDSTFGLWGRGLVTILITVHVLLVDGSVLSYQNVMKFLTFLGIATGMTVILHYVIGSSLNDIYFPLLNSTARKMAELYTRHGYYFGLLYNPHEPAGLIAFAIASLIIWKLISKLRSMLFDIGSLLLVVPLIMTGKKAVLVCLILALVITFLLFYKSRNQWLQIFKFVGTLALILTVFVSIAVRNPQIEIFNRFNQFFYQLTAGVDFDSGRVQLYRIAIEEWKDNPILGIGWRHFNALTTTKYGLTQSHEVNCDYLQWLCETGIIGFVLSIIPVVIMLQRTIYVEKWLVKNRGDDKEAWVLTFAVFIQFYTIIYAFVEIPFFDIVYYSVYILSCVVINSAYGRRKI